MHGPALTQAMSFLASRRTELPQWVWVLDSDVVISRPEALEKAVERVEQTGATVVGEPWRDDEHDVDRFLAYSLLIDPVRVWRDGVDPFVDGVAARHDDLLRAFCADVGPLDDPQAIEALIIPERLRP